MRVNNAQERAGLAGHPTQVAVSGEGAPEAERRRRSLRLGGGLALEVTAKAGAERALVDGRRPEPS